MEKGGLPLWILFMRHTGTCVCLMLQITLWQVCSPGNRTTTGTARYQQNMLPTNCYLLTRQCPDRRKTITYLIFYILIYRLKTVFQKPLFICCLLMTILCGNFWLSPKCHYSKKIIYPPALSSLLLFIPLMPLQKPNNETNFCNKEVQCRVLSCFSYFQLLHFYNSHLLSHSTG